MSTPPVVSGVNPSRRRLLKAAALAATGGELLGFGNARATGGDLRRRPGVTSPKGVTPSFPTIRQIDAGVLSVGYAEVGPADGAAVILLHGWPYDIHSYWEVATQLADRGCRVIVPHLRGHGTTRFLDQSVPRSGQQAALGADVISLMDALAISKAILAGYDWGGRAACVAAALWP